MATARQAPVLPRAARRAEPDAAREEIARVAYGLFEQRGCAHGHDQEDWLEAERLVRQRRRSGAVG